MPKRDPNALQDMTEISEYCNRSPATILSWVRNYGFPAAKIGGSWEADKRDIVKWKRDFIRRNSKPGAVAAAKN